MTTTPDELQARIRKAEGEVRRLERLPDPGAGRPGAEAQLLRQRHLRQLDGATSELRTLREEWRAGEPAEVQRQALTDRIFRKARRQAIAEAQTDEDRSFLRQLHEDMQERERERQEERERQDAEDRAAHPPDPRADSILAAVMADPIVLDTLEVRFRPIEGEEGVTATHVLDAHDVGVLAVTLTLLGARNPVRFEGWGHAPTWARREPRIAPVEHLRESLLELRRLGFLSLQVEGGTASASYGPRTREIAARWGITLGDEEDGHGHPLTQCEA